MALTPGTRLGVFDITAQIGEGGMGQVYRATDTKLKRQVAIKIPIDEALPIAKQIAEALEAAHEQGSFIAISSPRTSQCGVKCVLRQA